jgi:hypothetical protein
MASTKPNSSAPTASPSAITGATISVFGRIVPSAPVISSSPDGTDFK